jgi:PAS domain S-box-containing protein
VIAAPIIVGDRAIGVLTVLDRPGRVFDEEEMWLVQAFANQAAIALESARLSREADLRRLEAERLADQRQRALDALERSEARYRAIVEGQTEPICRWRPDTVLTFVNDACCRYFGRAREYLVGRSFLDLVAAEDRAGIERLAASLTPECPLSTHTERVFRADGSLRWQEWVSHATFDPYGRLIEIQSVARDVTELRQAQQVRKLLFGHVVTVQEEERKRIARELHDETAQSLASLLLGLRTVGKARTLNEVRVRAKELNHVARRALGEVRRLIFGLRPTTLDDVGLPAALDQYLKAWRPSRHVHVELALAGFHDERLPRAIETALFRIVQEALSNVARHARASAVRVALERRAAVVAMVISDDGHGFDAKAGFTPATVGHGLGLHGMQERAAALGGWLEIDSAPGHGTTITAELPLDGARP